MMLLKTIRGGKARTAPVPDEWPARMRRLRTQLGVITTASSALLWVDNLSEH